MEGERIWRGRGKASGYHYCNAGYIVCMSFFFYRLVLYLFYFQLS
jgi:hypothetical protein